MKVKIIKWDYLPSGTYELIETNGKLVRAIENVGFGATPRQILIEHDRIGGLIRDEEGKKSPIHTFWDLEKLKLVKKQRRKEKWAGIIKYSIFIGKYLLSILAALIAGYLIYKFGWNK